MNAAQKSMQAKLIRQRLTELNVRRDAFGYVRFSQEATHATE